jgi:hypothetical protein
LLKAVLVFGFAASGGVVKLSDIPAVVMGLDGSLV